jgi:hypothetical protein
MQWRHPGRDFTDLVSVSETVERDLDHLVPVIVGWAAPSRHADHPTPRPTAGFMLLSPSEASEERHIEDALDPVDWSVCGRVLPDNRLSPARLSLAAAVDDAAAARLGAVKDVVQGRGCLDAADQLR